MITEKKAVAVRDTMIGLSTEKIELVKRTVAKGATDDELALFVAVANRTGLDPFTRQIHFVKRRTWNKDTRKYEELGTIQTGIDGYRAVAARTGEHAGTDDAVIEEENGAPVKATVTVYRMIGGEPRAFTATARFSEYVQKYKGENIEKLSGQWAKMPFLMVSKCAEALALRKAFPTLLSGIYTEEEMDQAEEPSRKTKSKVIETTVKPEVPVDPNDAKRQRIVLLMKQAGLQPNENSAEAWAEAVGKAFNFKLEPENYTSIITALEATMSGDEPINV